MILDSSGQIASAWAPTLVQANLAPNVYDGRQPIDQGMGNDLGLYLNVVQAVTSAGAATVDFQVLGNLTDPTFAAGNLVLWDSGVVAKATLVAGYEFKIKFPRGFKARYFTLQATIGTAALTAGKFSAWMNPDNFQDNISYPAGFSIA